MIDLDDFKAYNDRFGHQAGDLVLKEAASAWRAEVRSTDLLARYGGEEFVLLLPACALEDAVQIVERLRVVTPLVTCSVGLACWDFQEDSRELLERADQALYVAKAEGRNRHVLAPDPPTRSLSRGPVPPAPESGPWGDSAHPRQSGIRV